MDNDILKLIKPEVRTLDTYFVPMPPHTIKLNQNESPFDLPVAIKEALLERVRNCAWSRYPKQAPEELYEELRASLKLPPEIDVLVGNGSNELIQTLFMATIERGTGIVISIPTFPVYRLCATVLGAKIIAVPLKADLTFDTDRILDTARKNNAKVIVLCRPNNPTGTLIPLKEVKRLASEAEALLVVDEAYHEFCKDSVLPLLTGQKNIVILRTFSKALRAAGLRIGYLLAQAPLVKEVAKAMLPFNVGILSREAALMILKNKELLQEGVQEIIASRKILFKELAAIDGVTPYPSQANFICFRTEKPARILFDALAERGILVRDVEHYPLLSDCLRVSVGTKEENRAFIDALKEIMEES